MKTPKQEEVSRTKSPSQFEKKRFTATRIVIIAIVRY